MRKVAVLLSTYNGANYIKELLDSILSQTYENFTVIIRDDFSTDNTLSIINSYTDNRVMVISGDKNLGSKRSFFELAKNSNNYDYYMFCDQDDIWINNKIELSVKEMEKLDSSNPILIYSDAFVTNKDLNIIHNSFIHYQKLPPRIKNNWKDLLSQNVIQGCTMCFNNKAKEIYVNNETYLLHHDHLLSVLVAKYGIIEYLDISLVKYRQHEENILGSLNYNKSYILNKLLHLKDFIKQQREIASFFSYPVLFLLVRKVKTNIYRILFK